ncbi:hypothetical protein FS749_001749 [Ceratobasidium sp. UAMH 11750]|nr:hypothetical protein FS749_001749 [Ceratobasidium sp. UAMH 11750]
MLSLHGSLQPDPFAPEHYAARQNLAQPAEADEPESEAEAANERIQEDSEGDIEVMEEEVAVPRGKRRKVVDVVPAAPEPETGPVKKKRKKSVVNIEASVVVAEAAITVVEGEEKKKRKKKKQVAGA